jgi:regulator of telomere elongation helicase 1
VEPRESHQFPLAMEDFYQKVKDPGKEGAIFFAVCRGKVRSLRFLVYVLSTLIGK